MSVRNKWFSLAVAIWMSLLSGCIQRTEALRQSIMNEQNPMQPTINYDVSSKRFGIIDSYSGAEKSVSGKKCALVRPEDRKTLHPINVFAFASPFRSNIWIGGGQDAYIDMPEGILGIVLTHAGLQITTSAVKRAEIAESDLAKLDDVVKRRFTFHQAVSATSGRGLDEKSITEILPLHDLVGSSFFDLVPIS